MSSFRSDPEEETTIVYDKFKIGNNLKLMRFVDYEAGVVLYTDSTRDGYTSVQLSDTDLPEEPPEE
jgi:hypothetical protein